MLRFRREVMGNRGICAPGGGTPPLREDGRLDGFAGEWGKFGRLYCVSPSVSFADSSLIRGSLWGAVRIRRGMVRIGEALLRQSLRLPIRADTSLYTREARGAAAPEEGFGCGGGRRLCGRSMIAPTYTTGNVTNSHCFSAKSNLFSHGTGNPSPTFSIATELCNFELKYRR